MASRSEYHISVRHLIPTWLALFSLLALPTVFASRSSAQINGAPASVTSPGFGGRAINGTPPSVTSLGPRGFAPQSFTGLRGPFEHRGDGRHRRHHFAEFAPPALYALPLPYAVDIGGTDDDADESDAGYQGGPTVFDRRGSGPASYVPPVRDVTRPHGAQPDASDPPTSEEPQRLTLFVFRDGHQLEVGNYAIVGATLFDLTPGHARRVALSDLDLEATQKLNDDRGVNFQFPQPLQAN